MDNSYTSLNLVEIDKSLSNVSRKVTLKGSDISISDVLSVSKYGAPVVITNNPKVLERIEKSYNKMVKDVKNGVPIYGCNTGYGARASKVVNEGSEDQRMTLARQISEGIAHVDVTVGPEFDKKIARGAMTIRINALMRGFSAVKIEDLEIYKEMLNHQVTPIVGQYGGIGASGDLAHNCRILSAARQLEGVKVWDSDGNVCFAKDLLQKEGILALKLDPKSGLGLVNGDNFSTSLAIHLIVDTLEALLIAQVVNSMAIEALKGTNRSFHPLLAEVRPHAGQREVASLYRYLLDGSKLAYQEMKGHQIREKGVKVQDAYSLRGIAQYHGVNFDKIKNMLDVITVNLNSVSDNPLWVPEEYTTPGEKPWQWVSGANFIAMHMVEVMDNLRKIMTQTVKLNDRHLARLVNPNENNGLPANLSDKKAITRCAFKGVQIQSGMLDVYSSLLSMPVSTFFGVHEEGNQDITSHALTSGILGLENLRLMRYSIAQNLLAVTQAADLRGGPKMLSSRTQPVYEFIRSGSTFVEKERPLNRDIESVYNSIVDGSLIKIVREKVLNDFE